jgi:hypothetical protein
MKRFANALVSLVSSAARAGSVLMERGAQRLNEYSEKQADPPPDQP